jgi:hypothetical protein
MNQIISPTDFIFSGTMFYQDFTGRYYQLIEPRPASAIARKGLMARRRISLVYFEECLEECKAQIALHKSQQGGAA